VATRSGSSRGRTPEPEPQLLVDAGRLAKQLDERIALADEMLKSLPTSLEELENAKHRYYSWTEYNETLIRKAFTSSAPADAYRGVSFGCGSSFTPFSDLVDYYAGDVASSRRRLESLRDQLPLYAVSATVSAQPTQPRAAQSKEVFIVHGHDARLADVARFVGEVTGRQPTILHERPNKGRTLIEKFEGHASNAGFAVVLLTGDDEGGLAGSGERLPRARQNVVFELGFFAGALGRENVAVLYEAGVEQPSDLDGLAYTEFDSHGAWRMEVARELKAAGIHVDAEKLL
jgi:predicted nucleotide-binding protein